MASRLCVKGLPKYVGEDRLREHFSAKGEVTDAKVVRSRDGASRQFGFIGFRSAEEAADALEYFNRTFIDTSRIAIEVAEKIGSQQIARPWSKYSKGSSAHKKQEVKQNEGSQQPVQLSKKAKRPLKEGEDDPQLAEFLQLMQPRRAGTIWSNDDMAPGPTPKQPPAALPAVTKPASLKAKRSTAAADTSEEEDDYQELPSTGLSHAHSNSSESDSDADSDADSDTVGGVKDSAVVNEDISDLDYLKSRMKAGLGQQDSEHRASSQTSSLTDTGQGDDSAEDKDISELDQASGQVEEDAEDAEAVLQHERQASHGQASGEDADAAMTDANSRAAEEGEELGSTGRLFLRNLPFSTTEAELSEAFSEFGDLQEVHLVLDRATKKSRGISYVQFTKPEDATAGMGAMDGSIFQGRLLHVLPARKAPAPPEQPEKENVSSGAKFKKAREAERKSQAGNRAAWNTLFVRADTVAEAVAAHYGITKSQLLSKEAADLPVRMALGEAHVIAMTKKALGDAGISVDALEAAAATSGRASSSHAVQRSPVCLIVKNLPYSASEEDLAELFGGSGQLARLILPPTKTLALVEFTEPQDARRAFKALAYKRYQHVPIYLEWAPANIFRADAPKAGALPLKAPKAKPAELANAPETADVAGNEPDGAAAAAAAVLPEVEDSESSTIYVKNLAFATGDAGLRKHFEKTVSSTGGSVQSVKVAMRKGPDGKALSMGFGFVKCSSEDVAKAVVRQLQGSVLDKHKLALQLSTRKASSAVKAQKRTAPEKQSTKLVVRNVAFEATRKDVMSLFSPFGHMKSCRLPRKFDGTPRGFAFIEFVTKQEAKNAMDSIAGAHLYGRRLVVEWAEQGDEGLDEIRAKTAAKFRGEAVDDFDELPTKRHKAAA